MVEPGLCASCRHAKLLRTKSGAVLVLCGRAADDERFPKYPRLPTRRCEGYDLAGRPGDMLS